MKCERAERAVVCAFSALIRNARFKYFYREVKYECKLVPAGAYTEFQKLGISVTLNCDGDVKPIIFFHRTPADTANMEIKLDILDEVLRFD